MQMDTAES